MKCPFCHHSESQVVETRLAEDDNSIRRRRQCSSCERRFTTYERTELLMPAVVKKDGRRVEFDVGKLRDSLNLALRKRPVKTTDVDKAILRIEENMLTSGSREIMSPKIGEWVMHELRKLDKIAYIRYASVYRSFDHIEDFKSLVDEVR